MHERPPVDPPRRPKAPDPEGKVRIMLERGCWPDTVSCFWHDGCQVRPYAMMVVISTEEDYSVVECGACGKKGRYPVGGSCMVTCDEDSLEKVGGGKIMHETTVPGINAQHALITDECRSMHGDLGAFHKAVFVLLKEYDATTQRRGDEKGVNYHLVLTVEDTKGCTCRSYHARTGKHTYMCPLGKDEPKPRGGHMASMPEPTPVKDSSERARRPTERLTKPKTPEAGSTLPKTPASSVAPSGTGTLTPEAEGKLHGVAQEDPPDDSSGGAECGI